MRRSVTYPWHCQLANWYRNTFNRFQQSGQAKKARHTAVLALSQIGRPKLDLDGVDNRIVVTLVRIASSYGDDDGLSGGDLKHVRDAVADRCGLDDRDRRIEFKYLQQAAPRGTWAVRIEIDDDEPGSSEERILGGVPDRLGAPRSRVCRGDKSDVPKEPKTSRKQAALIFRPAFAALPWDDADVWTELDLRANDPPKVIAVPIPAQGTVCGLRPGAKATRRRRSPKSSSE